MYEVFIAMSDDDSFAYFIPEDEDEHTLYLQREGEGDDFYFRPCRYPRSEADRICREIREKPGFYANSIEYAQDLVIFTNDTERFENVHAVPKHVVSYMVQMDDSGISRTLRAMLCTIDSTPDLNSTVYFRLCKHKSDVMLGVIERFKADFLKPMESTGAAGAAPAREEGEGGGWVSVKRPKIDPTTVLEKFAPFSGPGNKNRPTTKTFMEFLKREFLPELPIPPKITSKNVREAAADFKGMHTAWNRNGKINRVFDYYVDHP